MNLNSLTLKKAIELLKSKEVTPVELLGHYYKNIDEDNKTSNPLNAVVYKTPLETLTKKIDLNIINTPLAGAPVLMKDNMSVKGEPLTCCSNILSGYTAPWSGGAIEKLEKGGAIFSGRSNMDEFAMGSSTETSSYGPCKNPVNREYIPGGSSGGAASAVAGGHALCALGSDTGGSIRQPAACCGVTGLKPTYGLVSRYGLVAFGSSLDQIGPIAKTAEDCAILMNHISGHDHRDSTSSNRPTENYLSNLEVSLKGKKIGLPLEYFSEGLSDVVRTEVGKSIEFYKSQGAEIVEISLPYSKYAMAAYYIVATAEASANLARFDGVRYGKRSESAQSLSEVYLKSRTEGLGKEVKRRILLGTYVLSSGYYDAYYLQAQKVRRLIKQDFDKAFGAVDILLTPVMPDPVFKIGEKSDDPVKMYLSDLYTVAVNLGGVPAISLPCGKDNNNMPVSFQLIGKHFDESLLLNFAHIYQKETYKGAL